MSTHVEDYEEYQQSAAKGLLGSFAVHFVLGFVLWLSARLPAGTGLAEHLFLGHPGPTYYAPNLEVIEPNSVHFSFHQPAQRGVAGSPHISTRDEPKRASALNESMSLARQLRRSRSSRAASGVVSGGLGHAERWDGGGDGGQGGEAAMAGGTVLPLALPALQPDVPLSESFVILKLVKPIYPEAELTLNVSARVLVAVHVTPEGDVDEVQIQEAKTDPPASPHAFELASLEALKQWQVSSRYPHPQGYWLTIPIEFRPEDKDFGRLKPASSP